MIALIDCNNFYCSCERLFRPDLWKTPIVVLSNNDGCVISRSNEAKAMGIKMGTPFFKVSSLVEKKELTVFSSNFPLYADLSNRVMKTLQQFSNKIEYYSIDEAFIELNGSTKEIETTCHLIRETLYKHIGIPVSIGCAPTKVLAKAASSFSKYIPTLKNVAVWATKEEWTPYLHRLEIDDVWGIGHRLSKKCRSNNLYSAFDFAHYKNTRWIQKECSKLGRFIQEELCGRPCLDIETIKNKRQQIRVSRSFKKEIYTLSELQQALNIFVTRALEKCRSQNSQVQVLTIFFSSNPFNKNTSRNDGYHISLSQPSNNTLHILKCMSKVLKTYYKVPFHIKKAGVILQKLHDSQNEQLSFIYPPSCKKEDKLMDSIDQINNKFGMATCFPASCMNKSKRNGISSLQNKQYQSPRYTNNFNELLKVR